MQVLTVSTQSTNNNNSYKFSDNHEIERCSGHQAMPGLDDEGNNGLHQLSKLLDEWDKANIIKRLEMLNKFIDDYETQTVAELEENLANGATLFLVRVSVWLRLVYKSVPNLILILYAVGLFIRTRSDRYIKEFTEANGIQTLISIIERQKLNEEARLEALDLVCVICEEDNPVFAKAICKSKGITVCCELLLHTEQMNVQEKIIFILETSIRHSLAYASEFQCGVVSVLNCTNASAQFLVCRMLRRLHQEERLFGVHLIKPICSLLRSYQVDVQEQAQNLIKELVTTHLQKDILQELSDTLVPPPIDPSVKGIFITDSDLEAIGQPSHIHMQQALAAKLIRELCASSQEIARHLVEANAVRGLLVALGNVQHPNSQIEAGLALKHLCIEFPSVESALHEIMEESLCAHLKLSCDQFPLYLTPDAAEMLRNNNITVILDQNNGHISDITHLNDDSS